MIGLLCLANIIAYVDRTNLSVAIASKEFVSFFGLTSAQRGDLSSAFFWSYAFLQIPAGAVADRYGVKVPLAIGFLIWSLVSAATGWATALWQVFALRVMLGIGEAIITPGALRWIRFNVEEKRRGFVVGIFFAGAKLGPAIGTYAAVLLLQDYGWREMFVILGLGCMVWLIPWRFLARNDDREIEATQLKTSTTAAVPFGACLQDTSDLRHHHRDVRLQLLQLLLPDVAAGLLRRALEDVADFDGRLYGVQLLRHGGGCHRRRLRRRQDDRPRRRSHQGAEGLHDRRVDCRLHPDHRCDERIAGRGGHLRDHFAVRTRPGDCELLGAHTDR